jgi:hypothetical protein
MIMGFELGPVQSMAVDGVDITPYLAPVDRPVDGAPRWASDEAMLLDQVVDRLERVIEILESIPLDGLRDRGFSREPGPRTPRPVPHPSPRADG